MSRAPDFSPLAERYARGRPRYPGELFDWLAAQAPRRELVWDCATGNGQAAVDLAGRFARVVATDLSAEQLRHATQHPRIHYELARAESSPLPDGAVDLVTVAAAVHWFDLEAFAREVARVTVPGGVLAVWTYHVGDVEPPFDVVFDRLYRKVLKPYFAPQTRWVDERYATLPLPGTVIEAPRFVMTADWSLRQALDFIDSWSGTAAFREAHGEDPLDLVRGELEVLWHDEPVRTVRWPLYLRAVRLGAAAKGGEE